MAININHCFSFLIKRLKLTDFWQHLRTVHLSDTYFDQLDQGSEKTSDMPTVMEVRKRFMAAMGVKPGFRLVAEDRSYLLQYLPGSQDELPSRCVKDSFQCALIPLRTNSSLIDRYVNVLGNVRFGRLVEDMDMFAAWIAMAYVKNPKQPENVPSPYSMVTILVDHINFTDYIPRLGIDIRISGHVSCVWKTSLETTVWLEQDQQGIFQKITTATFLMAARNATLSGGAFVNRLVPKDEEEKNIISAGEARKRQRIALDTGSTLTQLPHPNEQKIVHKLFVESVDTTLSRRVLPPGAKWMADTLMTNNIFSFTEDRNLHNTVFGGFLMRHAVEMAWFTGYNHCKHRPRLISISNVNFKKPVPLGAVIRFHGQIVYTQDNFMQIFVHGDVTNPFQPKPITSIVFHFTYESQDIVTSVKPNTYYEAMMYIDGRRHFLEVMKQNNSSG